MNNLTVPSFKIDATGEQQISLKDFKGKNIVLFFYPKDNTPGCTIEAKDFTKNMSEFDKLNTVVFGVSRDSLKSHEKFKNKICMPFDLLSDPDEKLCNHFGVLGEKKLFGVKHFGLIRSTFLIDDKGNVVKEWRKVKVKNHVNDVLDAIREIM